MRFNITHSTTSAVEPYTIEYHGLNDPADIDTFDDLAEALAILADCGDAKQSVRTITINPNYLDNQADCITYTICA